MPAAKQTRIASARSIVLEHVEYFARHFGLVESHWKADSSRVTEADLTLSRNISQALSQAFPEDDCVSEEELPTVGARDLSARFCWVLDPIDGTNNYARGIPMCGISLGLLEDGYPVYGFIYDHLGRRFLEGGPGLGIRSDGRQIPVPKSPPVFDPRALVTLHFPVPEAHLRRIEPILRRNTVRCLGSAALNLSYNALGHFDGSIDHNTKVWDIAAAQAILEAAGRRIIFINENPFPLRKFGENPTKLELLAGPEAFFEFTLPLFTK
ncbi:MAG: inositol monophosphatase [Puniceicoccales bacterium]|jgi:myo-inositol-1(or 4)-monophosphatase|nr:inositol monophosphatase [Puniceicoccales bacterium]